MSKITIKTLDAIRRDRSKGDSPAEIAARYGVKPAFVRYHTRDIKPVRLGKRMFLDDKAEEILLLTGLGHTPREIAQRLGVSREGIRKALDRMEWKDAA